MSSEVSWAARFPNEVRIRHNERLSRDLFLNASATPIIALDGLLCLGGQFHRFCLGGSVS